MIKRDDVKIETSRLDKKSKELSVNGDTVEGLLLKGISVLIKLVANIRSNQTAQMRATNVPLRDKVEKKAPVSDTEKPA